MFESPRSLERAGALRVLGRRGARTRRRGKERPETGSGPTNGRNAGFSTAPAGKLYLPVDRARNAPSVAAQEKNPRSLLNRTRGLIALRRTEPALAAHAELVPLYAKKRAYPLVYLRTNGRRRVIVALNPGAEARRVRVQLPEPAASFERLAGNGAELQGSGKRITCAMDGRSYGVWVVQ